MHTAAHAGSCGVWVPGLPAASLAQVRHKAIRAVQLQVWHPLFTKKQVFGVSPAPAARHNLGLSTSCHCLHCTPTDVNPHPGWRGGAWMGVLITLHLHALVFALQDADELKCKAPVPL